MSAHTELTFALDTCVDDDSPLRDHRIFGEPVVPIDAYFDLVCAVAQERLGFGRIAIEGFAIFAPLVASRDVVSRANLVFREKDGRWTFAVKGEERGAARIYAKGTLLALDASPRSRPNLHERLGRCDEVVTREEMYRDHPAITSGSFYQSLESLRITGDVAAARIVSTPEGEAAREEHSLHPPTVSAMLMSAIAFANRRSKHPHATYAPLSIARVEISRPIDASSFAILTDLQANDGDTMTFDVDLVDHRGAVVASFLGLETTPIRPSDLGVTPADATPANPTSADATCADAASADAASADAASADAASADATAIAIVGYSGRFPKARGATEFWRNIAGGVDCIGEVPPSRWDADAYYDPDGRAPNKSASKWGGFVDEIDLFDPGFFGISPMEAESMDPQQRLFLEESYLAIEHAGLRASDVRAKRCGVFVGASMSDYETTLMRNGDDASAQAFTGMSEAILAARIAYFLDLKGPAVSIDTACSSSLVAINVACQSIASGESDMAIAGGVFVMVTPKLHIKMSKAGMLSKTGRCRTFDAAADGTVIGEAAGAVVLKRFSDAVRDRDPIHGIIRGYAVNQDGRTNGITAPNPQAQEQLERDVYDRFGIDPRTITYVETHGTGTPLGDPVEVDALTNAFRRYTKDTQFCVLGAVKANIGHATFAAGVAGVIKVLLALRHREIPPSAGFVTANPRIDLTNGPFRVSKGLAPWTSEGTPRRAAVSSFSFSGTNAHVVIEEGRAVFVAPRAAVPCQMFALSAKSETSLREYASRLATWLVESDESLADIAFTLLARRQHFRVRHAVVAGSREELATALGAIARGEAALTAKPTCDAKERGDAMIARLASGAVADVEYRAIARELGARFEADQALAWETWLVEDAHRTVALPGYAFERRRCWIEEPASGAKLSPMLLARPEKTTAPPALDEAGEVRWLRDAWVARAVATSPVAEPQTILVLVEDEARFARLHARLRQAMPRAHVIRATDPARLVEAVRADDASITHVIHDWARAAASDEREALSAEVETGFHSLNALSTALGRSRLTSPVKLVFLHPIERGVANPAYAAAHAALRTAVAENPRLTARMVGIARTLEARFATIAIDELTDAGRGIDVRYGDDGVRRERVLARVDTEREAHEANALRAGGVYLITGGMGAIGFACAKYLARECGARLALTGRSAPSLAHDTKLAEIERLGGRARYFACDVSREADVRDVVTAARDAFGPLHGVFHCAGNLRSIFAEKTRDAIDRVLAPKTAGTIAIDRATASEPLDFIALFSSISATFGNVGQADYAYANAFLDAFCERREAGRVAGERRGKTLSLAWPLWREGGVRVDRDLEKLVEDTMGMRAIGTALALASLKRGLSFEGGCFVVGFGDPGRLDRLTAAVPAPVAHGAREDSRAPELSSALDLEAWLGDVVASMLKVDRSTIAPEDDFGDYGFDSIILTELVNRINDRLAVDLTPALMFEHRSLRACATYLRARGAALAAPPSIVASPKPAPAVTLASSTPVIGDLTVFDRDYSDALEGGWSRAFGRDASEDESTTPITFAMTPHVALAATPPVASAARSTIAGSGDLESWLCDLVANVLKVEASAVSADDDFSEYGFDSIILTELANRLNDSLALDITPALLFEHRNIRACASYLRDVRGILTGAPRALVPIAPPPASSPVPIAVAGVTPGDVAIIGMAGQMPRSDDLDAFWGHLAGGDSLIGEVPVSRWEASAASVARGGFMNRVDTFDAAFFSIAPREAALMDPQQRLLLQSVWATIEDAGYRASSLSGSRTGVFVGVITHDYAELLHERELDGESLAPTGLSTALVANRISYVFNFTGPSEPVDTACSSSLVAIHRACESLRAGECDLAIAGGVNLLLAPTLFRSLAAAGVLSPDGQQRTFDRSANGYVRGEGLATLLLKPLARALADGDHVHGVIRGTAVNHGGRAQSLTAPNPIAQARLLVDAYRRAKISPEHVSLIETHGSGTSIGDPIEINALKTAFAELYAERGLSFSGEPHCALGAVKASTGHLEGAAGIAGVVKVLLAMRHATLPPQAGFAEINPQIRLEGTPFYVSDRTRAWDPPRGARRIAGVSSFGFGGANAHIVIEEGPSRAPSTGASEAPVVLLVSAKSEAALARAAEAILNHLQSHLPDAADIAFTTQVGREALPLRIAVYATNGDELVARLAAHVGGSAAEGVFAGRSRDKRSAAAPDDMAVTAAIGINDQRGLAALWASGADVDWSLLRRGAPARRVPLPTYPFAHERHWFDRHPMKTNSKQPTPPTERAAAPKLTLKPLVAAATTPVAIAAVQPRAIAPVRPRSVAPSTIREQLRKLVADVLLLDAATLDESLSLADLGLDSILGVELMKNVNAAFGANLHATALYDHNTIERLARRLDDDPPPAAPVAKAAQVLVAPTTNSSSALPAIRERLRALLADALLVDVATIEDGRAFADLGLDSILGVELVKNLNTAFGTTVGATELYDRNTITLLAQLVASLTGPARTMLPEPAASPTRALAAAPIAIRASSTPREVAPTHASSRDVAIIGVAAKFAGAPDVETYWSNLRAGVCSVREVPASRWTPRDPSRRDFGGFLDDVDRFDPLFFNLSPSEAALMDPQQRLFLEAAWSALEVAGYSAERLDHAKCGVFVAVQNNDYIALLAQRRPDLADDAKAMLGNANPILAARIAYLLNLKGPAVHVDTACSGALVALHLARQSLLAGEADMMIVGGVTLYLAESTYSKMHDAGMLSPSGKCHTFDRSADGFVPGEGVGVVVLKPLDKALADGDRVLGVIKGSGINQDGKTNGITAPSADSQAALELDVYRRSGIDADTISYVEAHGTGTKLGDPIEVKALTRAFAAFTQRTQFCGIGSAKTNIGHASAASGMAGLIKVLLAFEHQELPPSLHLEEENPLLDLVRTPFRVITRTEPWMRTTRAVRRAAVSAFSFSGTNAHIVLEEPPARAEAPVAAGPQRELIVLSARDPAALVRSARALADALARAPQGLTLADVAYTLQLGRTRMEERIAFVASSIEEARTTLAALAQGTPVPAVHRASAREGARDVDWLLDGPEGERYVESLFATGNLEKLAKLWSASASLDWRCLRGGRTARTVALPTYPFARESYWLPNGGAPPVKATSSGVVDAARSVDEGALVVRSTVSADDTLARAHDLGGRAALPGAAYFGFALEAGALAGASESVELLDIAFREPMFVSSDRIVETIVTKGDGGLVMRVSSVGVDDDRVEHATCALRATSARPAPIALDPIRARCPRSIIGDDLYVRFAALGLTYGAPFRAARELRASATEVLATIAIESAAVGDRAAQAIVLDCAMHCAMAMALAEPDAALDAMLVPVAVGRVQILRPLPDAVLAYARRTQRGATTMDVTIVDDAGSVVAVLERVVTRAVASPRTNAGFYAPKWVDAPSPASAADRKRLRVAVIHASDEWRDRPLALAVADEHRRRGDAVAVIDVKDDDTRAVTAKRAEVAGADRIYFLSDGTSTEIDLAGSQRRGVRALFRMMRAFVSGDRPAQLRELLVVTRGAHRVLDEEPLRPYAASLNGFARSIARELLDWRVGIVDVASDDVATTARLLVDEAPRSDGADIAMRGGRRRERVIAPVAIPAGETPAFKRDGVYLIVGGLGGIGYEVAKHLATTANARLVLVGRSAESDATRAKVGALGSDAIYVSADLTDARSLGRARDVARGRFGHVDGVFHSALVLEDATLANMSERALEAVLAPKVAGSAALYEVFRDDPLDFLVFLSSGESFACDAGQSNYCAASTFEDAYASWLRASARFRVVVVNWGFWGTVGVAASERYRRELAERGIESIEPHEGMAALERILAQRDHLGQVAFVKGDLRVTETVRLADRQAPAEPMVSLPSKTNGTLAPSDFRGRVVAYVKEVFSEVLKIDADKLAGEVTLERFGVDSLVNMKLLRRFERDLGKQPSTLLFEHMTIERLADHLASHSGARLASLITLSPAARPELPPAHAAPPPSPPPRAFHEARGVADEDVAIVGCSGRYPLAANVEQLWENLKAGRNCITEVPTDRWDPARFTDVIYSKYGGFIEDVDKFDYGFFGVLPDEADLLDPQLRLFLECAWEAFEDAGVAPRSLDGIERDVGVFVGVMNSDYEILSAEAYGRGAFTLAHSSHWSIANRVSYHLDLHGPSVALDTACSSSLTAVHYAVESVRRGECRMALVGGVNLVLHPLHYRRLCSLGMITADDRCKAFGEGADGFVDGEGVGALLIKRLADAVRDGDRIYAVIKGSAANAGGKTGGFTVPNPNAQAAVITRALDRAGIDARSISYVEAHGTGTDLGDPIEIAGLTKAFRAHTSEAGFCALGSVKSNIGHLESAAGIAALTKAALQLSHRTLVPSLHAGVPSAKIDLEHSPFRIQRDLAPWAAGSGPRRACVSSFGAGGANAHVVLEEFVDPRESHERPSSTTPRVLVLSAKRGEALRAHAVRLLEHLGRHRDTLHFDDVVHTLQVGREAMMERLAIVARDADDAITKLARFVQGADVDGVYRSAAGDTNGNARGLAESGRDSTDPEGLARAWVSGTHVDWPAPGGESPRRVALPTYAFARNRCWFTAPATSETNDVGVHPTRAPTEALSTTTLDDVVRIVADAAGRPLTAIDPGVRLEALALEHYDVMTAIKRLNARYGKRFVPKSLIDGVSLAEVARTIDGVAEPAALTPPAPAPPSVVAPAQARPAPVSTTVLAPAPAREQEVLDAVHAIAARIMKVPVAEVDVHADLGEYGLDSINVMFLVARLRDKFGVPFDPKDLVSKRTLKELAGFIAIVAPAAAA